MDNLKQNAILVRDALLELRETTPITAQRKFIDKAIPAAQALVDGVKDDWLSYIAKEMHYPDCWDTVAYPTIYDAIGELARCNAHDVDGW